MTLAVWIRVSPDFQKKVVITVSVEKNYIFSINEMKFVPLHQGNKINIRYIAIDNFLIIILKCGLIFFHFRFPIDFGLKNDVLKENVM